MKHLIIDIETGASPDAEKFKPAFEAPGNLKDPEKIKSALAEKELAWRDKLALSATTGQVLCAGILSGGEVTFIQGPEKEIVTSVFVSIDEALSDGYVVGHNLLGFDLPFLRRRAWKLGVKIPFNLTLEKSRYWHGNFADTMLLWASGERSDTISLANLAKFLGVGEKTGNGKDFASLYLTDKTAALTYLENDLRLTEACYLKMI